MISASSRQLSARIRLFLACRAGIVLILGLVIFRGKVEYNGRLV